MYNTIRPESIGKYDLAQNILETKNTALLLSYMNRYGELSLLELEDYGLDYLARLILISKKYYLIDNINKVGEMRKVLDRIVNLISYDNEMDDNILSLVRNIKRTVIDTQIIYNEKMSFLSKLIKNEYIKMKENSDYNSSVDEIIISICHNPYLNMNDYQVILEFIAKDNNSSSFTRGIEEFFMEQISNLNIVFSSTLTVDITSIVNLLANIIAVMDILKEKYDISFNKENLLRRGLREFMNSSWIESNAYRLYISILNTSILDLRYHKDVFVLFFEEFTKHVVLEGKESSEEYNRGYSEEYGYAPFEHMMNEIEMSTIDGLAYSLFNEKDLLDMPMYVFYSHIKAKVEMVRKSTELLIDHEILPVDYNVDPGNYIKILSLSEDNRMTESMTQSTIDSILDDINGLEI